MNIRRPFFWFVAVIAAAVLALLFVNRKPAETPGTMSVETNAPLPGVIAASSSKASEPPHAITAQRTNGAAGLSQSLPGNKAEQMIGILSTYNDVPINFYGKVEDQFSNAVANATVNFTVRIYNGTESTVKRNHVMTDASGYFTISGYKGESLGLVPAKAGYALATTATLFKYSHLDDQHYVPDQNNPTLIKMWKLQGAEPLVSINKTYKLRYTPGPIYFDLIAGQVAANGGDLQITVNRPAGDISGRNPLNWSITVSVVGGGLIETSQGEAAMTYAAPTSGYQPTGIFEKNNGPDLVDKMLFIQSRNGQIYSKVHLLFGINNTPDGFMDITFTGVADTNGSPNWEATAPQQ